MKKLMLLLCIMSLVVFVGCTKTQENAEIKYIDENQTEQVYIIKKTEDLEEVKQLASILKNKKIDTNFNGARLLFTSEIEGKITINELEKRTIDLGYTFDIDAQANLKKYRLGGTLKLEGYTNTESPSLSLKTTDQLTAEISNDDSYLYVSGGLKTGNTQINVKHKLNIDHFTEESKAMIVSSLDVLKYYKLTEIIPNMEEFVDLYHITIVDTTKDTFTIRLNLSSDILFPNIENKDTISLDVKISCLELLPIECTFSLDQLISNILHTEYVNKYLSDKVIVEQAKGKISLKMEYGYFNIQELTEEEKQEYREYTPNQFTLAQ